MKARSTPITGWAVPAGAPGFKRVRTRNGAVVYDIDGNQIPGDRFVTAPVSPGLMRALKFGDLEEEGGETSAPRPRETRSAPKPITPRPPKATRNRKAEKTEALIEVMNLLEAADVEGNLKRLGTKIEGHQRWKKLCADHDWDGTVSESTLKLARPAWRKRRSATA